MPYMRDHIWWYRIQTVIILTTGTMLLMWFGEQITERGIGNGISLVITHWHFGATSRGRPRALMDMFTQAGDEGGFNPFYAIVLFAALGCA